MNSRARKSTVVHRLRYAGGFSHDVAEPFNFTLSMWKPSHFATGLETHTANSSWRTYRDGKYLLGARVRRQSDDQVRVDIWSSGAPGREVVRNLSARIALSYGFADDLSPFWTLVAENRHESTFRPLLGTRISCPESVFEIAVLSVLLQNTTISRTSQMLAQLLDRLGGWVCFDGMILRSFFSPGRLASLSEHSLRQECRVGYRAGTLLALANEFASQPKLRSCGGDAEALIHRLLRIRGIGPYSAGVIANAACRNLSALGLDVWNTKLAGELFGLNAGDATIERVASLLTSHYPGYEGLALMYLTEARYLDAALDPLAATVADARRRCRSRLLEAGKSQPT